MVMAVVVVVLLVLLVLVWCSVGGGVRGKRIGKWKGKARPGFVVVVPKVLVVVFLVALELLLLLVDAAAAAAAAAWRLNRIGVVSFVVNLRCFDSPDSFP